MKIIDEKITIVPFGDVLEGECFIYETDVCMKIEKTIDRFGNTLNVVDLETGALGYLIEEENVETIEAELRIK